MPSRRNCFRRPPLMYAICMIRGCTACTHGSARVPRRYDQRDGPAVEHEGQSARDPRSSPVPENSLIASAHTLRSQILGSTATVSGPYSQSSVIETQLIAQRPYGGKI